MITEKKNSLKHYKWKVCVHNFGYGEYYWVATSEDESLELQSKVKRNKKITKEDWEQFAIDNRIKTWLYI